MIQRIRGFKDSRVQVKFLKKLTVNNFQGFYEHDCKIILISWIIKKDRHNLLLQIKEKDAFGINKSAGTAYP